MIIGRCKPGHFAGLRVLVGVEGYSNLRHIERDGVTQVFFLPEVKIFCPFSQAIPLNQHNHLLFHLSPQHSPVFLLNQQIYLLLTGMLKAERVFCLFQTKVDGLLCQQGLLLLLLLSAVEMLWEQMQMAVIIG